MIVWFGADMNWEEKCLGCVRGQRVMELRLVLPQKNWIGAEFGDLDGG